MRLKEIRPIIRTNQLKETVAFYVQQLGFTCGEYNEAWGWAAFHRDDIEIMAAGPLEAEPFGTPCFTGSFYFLLEDGIDDLWEELKDKARRCYDLETFDYGMREFALYDNNGYLLQFGQTVDRNEP